MLSVSVTFCTDVNVPAAGLNVGAAAAGGGGDEALPPPPLQPTRESAAKKFARMHFRIILLLSRLARSEADLRAGKNRRKIGRGERI